MAYYDDTHLRRLREIEDLKKGCRVPVSFLKKQITSNAADKAVALPDFSKAATTPKEKQKRREEIIRKAIEVFSTKGYHGVKIVDITGALKISTGTFYLYFQDKRELFIEVIDHVFRNIVGEAAIAIKGEEDFVERMKIRGRVFYKNYTRYSEILNQLRAEMASEERWPADKIKKIYHGLTQPLIREIEAAANEGIIRKVDADLLGYSLTGLIEIMSLRLSLDKKYNLDDVIEFLSDLIVDSFLKSRG